MQLTKQQDNDIVPHFGALKRRVDRFIAPAALNKEHSAKMFFDDVGELGEVAIFGGLLRDLCLETNRTFYSDIDVVIETDDERGLASKVAKFDAMKNSFGGYRLQYRKWKIDVWPLRKTWAFREGLVKGESFDSLLETTFFDWDALVFNWSKSKVYSIENYLEKLNERVVGINLRENPNDIGMIVRALRLIEKRDAKLSHDLSEYVFSGVDHYGINTILEDELDSYSQNLLTENFISNIYSGLKNYLEMCNKGPFCHRYKYQLNLFD